MAVAENDFEGLVNAAERLAEQARRRPTWHEARAALTESGVMSAIKRHDDAPDILDAAQRELRAAQQAEQIRREEYDAALTEAEWELDGRFIVEGNKTYLVDGEERRAMTADERSKWKALEAKKTGAVAVAAKALREAEESTARARDEVRLAEARLSVTKHELIARTAVLQHFTYAIKEQS